MLPLISFETGRKTQTQSSDQDHSLLLEQLMEVWFYSRIGTAAERPIRRADEPEEFTPALLRMAFCLLTKTYHGSRLTVHVRTGTHLSAKSLGLIGNASGRK